MMTLEDEIRQAESHILESMNHYTKNEDDAERWKNGIMKVFIEGKKRPLIQEAKTASDGYQAVFFGAPFIQVEKYLGAKVQSDPVRCLALVYAAYYSLAQSGSTRIPLEQVIQRCWKMENNARVYPEVTFPLHLGAAIVSKGRFSTFSIQIDDGGQVLICDKGLASCERQAADHLKSIRDNAETDTISEALIREAEEALGVQYDQDQRKAFELLSHGVGILTGGPGTGKTTTLRGLIYAWKKEHPFQQVYCCALSNRAAIRMREATGEPATTIHKLLQIIPYTPEERYSPPPADLDTDCLVVLDEASMIDIELADKLTGAVDKAHGQLLIVGDEDQLQSVGPGALLRDVIASDIFPIVRLRTIHRQAGESVSIAENAALIRDGHGKMKNDEHFQAWRYYGPDSATQVVQKTIQEYITARSDIGLDALDVQIYTPIKKLGYTKGEECHTYEIGTASINAKLHEMYGQGKSFHHCNGQNFSKDDPVIYTGKGDDHYDLHNGDVGIVTKADEKSITVNWRGDVGEIELTKNLQRDLELAYATSVHKAQGGQTKMAIVALPDYERTQVMLTREMLYVGVTRAEEKCVVVAQGDSIRKCINNPAKDKRKTGLVEELRRGERRRKCTSF